MIKLTHVPLNYSYRTPSKHDAPQSPWFPLHSHNPKTWDEARANAILSTVISNLKTCGGCRQHAIDYTKRNHIDFSSRERYHDYLWRFHNTVNERIGNRPTITWEQYEREWLRWKPVDGLRIGFVAGCYDQFGGTETFHQTLLPRLPGVIGFASMADIRGDATLLGVPFGSGESAIASLSSYADVIVSWSIDWQSRPRPKRLITVHHGSPAATWDTSHALQGDSIVTVSAETALVLRDLTTRPVRHIQNAVDPLRIQPQNAVETNGKKICLWPHRWSREKRPELAIAIAEHLPSDWHMVLTGYRGEFPCVSTDKVTVLPPQRTGDWLAVASCMLCTSTIDGYNLSIAEARTAGIPVVSTPVGLASQPGIAITLPFDASPSEWAQAIVSSEHQVLPPPNLFSLDDHIAAWSEVVSAES